MKKTILFSFIALTLLITTCKREYIGDYDANYVGEWHSDTFTTSSGVKKEIYFIINGNNSQYGFMCELNCSVCNCQLLTSGKAVINNRHKKLIIGSGNGKPRVRVNLKTPPYQNSSGKWICVIEDSDGDDITMYKK